MFVDSLYQLTTKRGFVGVYYILYVLTQEEMFVVSSYQLSELTHEERFVGSTYPANIVPDPPGSEIIWIRILSFFTPYLEKCF